MVQVVEFFQFDIPSRLNHSSTSSHTEFWRLARRRSASCEGRIQAIHVPPAEKPRRERERERERERDRAIATVDTGRGRQLSKGFPLQVCTRESACVPLPFYGSNFFKDTHALGKLSEPLSIRTRCCYGETRKIQPINKRLARFAFPAGV
jgi:hypothetical protein